MSAISRPNEVPHIVIAGGGIAALETLIALRALAGDRVRISLVSPQAEFVNRPMTVAAPFGAGEPDRYPLARFAADFDARLVRASVTGVEPDDRRVRLRSGAALDYDILVLAPGARTLPAFDDAVSFGGADAIHAMRTLLGRLERGEVTRVAFVVPTVVGWSVPLYELALMTAATVRARGIHDVQLSLITPEERPLEAFGPGPSELIARLLLSAHIDFVGRTQADVDGGLVRLTRSGETLPTDAVVSLPLVRGPLLEGVPLEPRFGFIPVDRHGRVAGLDRVYAAGDATDYPIKQGGLAAQQADAVAHHIAAMVGAPTAPSPFRPVLRGLLFTGEEPRSFEVDPEHIAGGRAQLQPLWRPSAKIAGRHLSAYLGAAEDAVAAPPQEVELPVHHREPEDGAAMPVQAPS